MRTILILLLFVSSQMSGQDLISSTLSGSTLVQGLEPNLISQEFGNLKSANSIDLFALGNLKKNHPWEYASLKISEKAIQQLKNHTTGVVEIKIPISKDAFIPVLMKRVQIFTDDLILRDENDNRLNPSKIHSYRGYVTTDQGSFVNMTIIEDEIHLSMHDGDGSYRINRQKNNAYTLYKDISSENKVSRCETADEGISTRQGRHGSQPLIDSGLPKGLRQRKSAGDIVEIFFECDFQMFINKGRTIAGVEAYIAILMNELAAVYANQGIVIQVSDILVWTSADPYISMSVGNPIPILYSYSSTRKDDYQGRLAALIIGRFSGFIGGVAWVNVLCSTYEASYGGGPHSINYGMGIFPINSYPNYSYDVGIIAHELGHNFGSPHTQACAWGQNFNQRIDACSFEGSCSLVTSPTPSSELGTIMSYCGGNTLAKGFGTEPGNLIYDRYFEAECLLSGGPDCTIVNETYNNETIGSTEVVADNSITIIDNVSISRGALVMWQAENQIIVNGSLTMSAGSTIEMIADECK